MHPLKTRTRPLQYEKANLVVVAVQTAASGTSRPKRVYRIRCLSKSLVFLLAISKTTGRIHVMWTVKEDQNAYKRAEAYVEESFCIRDHLSYQHNRLRKALAQFAMMSEMGKT